MKNVSDKIRLLLLLSLFFIYKAISEYYLNQDTDASIVWTMITIVYIISIIILIFVIKRLEKGVASKI